MCLDSLAHVNERMLPFATLLGITFISATPEKIVAELTVREDLQPPSRARPISSPGAGRNAGDR
jgi:acyl-coenzyme A thioesterase PaaI-like protein